MKYTKWIIYNRITGRFIRPHCIEQEKPYEYATKADAISEAKLTKANAEMMIRLDIVPADWPDPADYRLTCLERGKKFTCIHNLGSGAKC